MKTYAVFLAFLINSVVLAGMALAQINNRLIELSRNNSARVLAPDLNSAGTGFFLGSTYVATCFHVIATIEVTDPTKGEVRWTIANNIKIVLNDGEIIDAKCVSIPTQQDASPLENDFAILKLDKKPKTAPTGLSLYRAKEPLDVGSDVLFSGYPLGAPAMITHKGYVSGVTQDQRVICIQAPINKGISGGALLNTKGEVIGLISNREGGISKGLADVTKQITDVEQGLSGVRITTSIGGVNTLAVTKELILTLDTYISTGIGYARSIKAMQDYLAKNPNLLK